MDGKGKDLTDVHLYNVDSVFSVGTKNETVHLDNGTFGSLPGKVNLGAGTNDTLILTNNDYRLNLQGVENVFGDETSLSLSGTAAFKTDGSVESISGDKYAQLITYDSLTDNSTIDLGKGADKIILNFDNDIYSSDGKLYAFDNHTGYYLEMSNMSGNTSLTIIDNGHSYTWTKALSTFTNPPPVMTDDTMLNDTIGSDAAHARIIAVDSIQYAAISSLSDIDMFKVHLEAGSTYQIDAEGAPSGDGTLSDTWLNLYNTDGTSLIAQDDDSGIGWNSSIQYTAATTGDYYFSVESYYPDSHYYTGTYAVEVTGVV
ncbi:MAG: PPC domain-containing protein [Methylovulum sp.]|nr:PPC domain-containing protein [Methylovulum sp.]